MKDYVFSCILAAIVRSLVSCKIIGKGAFVGCEALADVCFEVTDGWYYSDNNQQEVVLADTSENTEELEEKKNSKNAAKVLKEGEGSKYDLFRAA